MSPVQDMQVKGTMQYAVLGTYGSVTKKWVHTSNRAVTSMSIKAAWGGFRGSEGWGREGERTMYVQSIAWFQECYAYIYKFPPAPLKHFMNFIFHYRLIHVAKGVLGKVTHVWSRQPTRKQNTKSPASNYFAVFWVTTSCGLVRWYRRAYMTVNGSPKTVGR